MRLIDADALMISIHVPREGNDRWIPVSERLPKEFQSTFPARGTTYGTDGISPALIISIHVPREGNDMA